MNGNKIVENLLLGSRLRWFRHLLLNLGVLFITIDIFYDLGNVALVFTPDRISVWAAYYIAMAFSLYVNIFYLTPKYILRGRWLPYIGGMIGCMLLIIIIMTLSSNIWGPDKNEMAASPVNVISSMVSLSLFFMGTSAIVVMRRWLISNRRLAELESATLESELKFLKKQINPHFLFNMLNNAYMLVNKQSLDAGNVLLRLEDMLKYQIEDSSKDSVRLEDDIKFIRDFLDLENIRRDKFKFDIQIDGTVEKIDIPPLIFIPFVENAVKHNADSDTISYVDIRFSARDGKLCFICENSKPDIPSEEVKVGGLGLKNIRRRLELLFPNRHDLKVMDTENTYTVILNLDL